MEKSSFLEADEIKAMSILDEAKQSIQELQKQINNLQPDKFRVLEYRPHGTKTSRPPGTQNKEITELRQQQEDTIKFTIDEIKNLMREASTAVKENISQQLKEWEKQMDQHRNKNQIGREQQDNLSIASKFVARLNYSKFNTERDDSKNIKGKNANLSLDDH